MEGPTLSGLLLGLLVPPLLSFQEDSLERRHDARLVKKDKERNLNIVVFVATQQNLSLLSSSKDEI